MFAITSSLAESTSGVIIKASPASLGMSFSTNSVLLNGLVLLNESPIWLPVSELPSVT